MLLKIISVVGSLTFLSRILGYVRDLLIARVIGAGMISDCFFVAFKLPNLFRRLFGEGAMNSAFIPVVSGIKSKSGKNNADIFLSKIFSILIVFLFLFVILAEIFMPLVISIIAPGFINNPEKYTLSIDLSRLTFPFVFFICLTSLIGAYLNTLGRFASMAVTPVILNLSLISVLLLFFKTENRLEISNFLSASVSIAGVIQLFWLYLCLKRNGSNLYLSFSFNEIFKKNKETSKFFKLLLPAVIGNGAYQINLLIDMILASTLPDGSISYLYYADRVNQLPLGVLGIAISTALLPTLSRQVKEKKIISANKSFLSAIKFGIIFSIPAFVGILILSDEIIEFLFMRGAFQFYDVELTAKALKALCFGLPAFIMIKVLVVPFFANEDTKTPIKISIFCMVINLILNLILIKEFMHVGLAISTSIAAWINVVILVYMLKNKLSYSLNLSVMRVIIKVIFSSVLMSYLVLEIYKYTNVNFADYIFFGKNFYLIVCIILGVIIYALSLFIIGRKELELDKWKTQQKNPN